MQGSSALQAMLDEVDGPMTVFAVWEPIEAGQRPPPSETLAILTDPRVLQLWDPDHVLSDAMRAVTTPELPQAWLRTGESDAGILYDAVALFPQGGRWEETLPGPSYVDGGLERVLPAVRGLLGASRTP